LDVECLANPDIAMLALAGHPLPSAGHTWFFKDHRHRVTHGECGKLFVQQHPEVTSGAIRAGGREPA
jgi:hypothetical protein